MKTSTLKIGFNLGVLAATLALAWAWSGQAPHAAGSGDLWLHRAIGRAMADPAGLPRFEPFSHTIPADQPFRAGSRIYSVAVYELARAGWAHALDIWRAVAMLLIVIFLVAAAYRRGARPFSSSLAALAALLALWRAPLDFLSVAALLAAALYVMEGPFWSSLFSRWLWVAPLLALAANLHPSALALGGMAALWALFDQAPEEDPPPDNPGLTRVIYAAALLCCLALSFDGFALWREFFLPPWNLIDSTIGAPFGQTWLNSSWPPLILAGAALFFVAANTWVSGGERRRRRDLALAVGLGVFVALRPDWIALMGVWAAPVIASRSDAVIDAMPYSLRQGRWLVKIPVFAALLLALPRLHATWRDAETFPTKGMPDRVLSFMQDHHPGPRYFLPAKWSGYVAWHLSGRAQVFVDARGPKAYSATVLADYQGAESGGLGGEKNQREFWREIFNRRELDAALLEIDSPLARTLARARGWQPVAFDNNAVLYVRATKPPRQSAAFERHEERQAMIKTWAPRGLRPGDLTEPFTPGRLQQSEADLEVRLARDPDLGILYLYQSMLRAARDDIEGARESLRRGIQADPEFAANYQWLGLDMAKAGREDEARRLWIHSLKLKDSPQVRAWLAEYGGGL